MEDPGGEQLAPAEVSGGRQSEEEYRLLVENCPVCIHQIDLSGRLMSMNRAGLTMLGLDDESEIVEAL